MRLVTEENLNTIYADVDISTASVNILQNVNGALLVRGTADNIKYGQNSNVEAALDNLTSASTGNLAAAKAYTDEQVAIEKARAEGLRRPGGSAHKTPRQLCRTGRLFGCPQ